MKNYAITVNGVVYDVTVEDRGAVAGAPIAAPVAPAAPAAPAVPAVPAAPVAPKAPAAPVATGNEGSVKIESQIQGKVFKIEAPVGTNVKSGDAIIIIESMKMEIPIASPQDGTVASINVKEGDMIDAGALIATLN